MWNTWSITAAVAVLAVLPGCPEEDDDDQQADDDTVAQDDDTSPGDDDTGGSEAEVLSTYPEDGAADAYYRTDIEVVFDRHVDDVAISLIEEDTGTSIPGELTHDGDDDHASFDPFGGSEDEHLQALTSYLASITWDGHDPVELRFQTSEVGTPLTAPQTQVVGNDYVFNLGTATWIEPPESSLTSKYFLDIGIGFQVEAIEGDTFAARGAIVERVDGSWIQDLCQPSLDWDEAAPGYWNNPYLHLGPVNAVVAAGGYDADFPGLTVGASFAPGAETLEGGTFGSFMVVVGFDMEGPEAICDLLSRLGIECVECPHDSSMLCLPLTARSMTGAHVEISGIHPETGESTAGITEVTPEMVEAWQASGICH